MQLASLIFVLQYYCSQVLFVHFLSVLTCLLIYSLLETVQFEYSFSKKDFVLEVLTC